jgi:hypothetical protein
MSNSEHKMLLVGDNPFQGISHLSQERARTRGRTPASPRTAVDVVHSALENGADGFTFSVSDFTLSMLGIMRDQDRIDQVKLYAMVPYAFEYVRVATQTGTPGLAKRFVKQIAVSGDVKTILTGLKTVLTLKPEDLLRTYVTYEISRIMSSAGRRAKLVSLLLNEVVTDLALALDFDWLFKSYIDYLLRLRIKPGFNTRNFPYLVSKFEEWNVDVYRTWIVAPFNKVGFQMNPSREDCEKALTSLPRPIVLAMSILAAGYLKLPQAIDYVATLPNIGGVCVGVSKDQHARESFRLLKSKFH